MVSQSLMIEKFVRKATLKFGSKYIYDKINYIHWKSKVCITCRIHGDFYQIPNNHTQGSGCMQCGGKYPYTTESFIAKAITVHGNKYDYSKVVYVNSRSSITIICKDHGEFHQQPDSHLQGKCCFNCKGTIAYTNETFIQKALSIHGHVYDYSNINYVNFGTHVEIICNTHGKFLQAPRNHLALKQGCPKCSISFPLTTKSFIEKANIKHNSKYDYSETKYINAKIDIHVICRVHGIFSQNPGSHLFGSGCVLCGNETKRTAMRLETEDFIRRAKIMHGTKFDYSKVDYICMKEKVTIICLKHGDFLQTAHNHLTGSECPSCMNKTEHKLYITLQPTYTSLIRQYRQQWCVHKSMLPFDFCIPELNIIIELDGPQHFRQVMNWQSPEENLKRDKFKTECANANDYSIIRLLQEDVWDDKFDWRKELCDAIEKIRGCDTFLNIYICRNNEYANHAREEYI